jgi:hypothetical protein
MEWRFWKWGKNDKQDAPAVADAVPHDVSSLAPLLTASSATELLALQRAIGNQAVLQMVSGNRQSPAFRTAGNDTQ